MEKKVDRQKFLELEEAMAERVHLKKFEMLA